MQHHRVFLGSWFTLLCWVFFFSSPPSLILNLFFATIEGKGMRRSGFLRPHKHRGVFVWEPGPFFFFFFPFFSSRDSTPDGMSWIEDRIRATSRPPRVSRCKFSLFSPPFFFPVPFPRKNLIDEDRQCIGGLTACSCFFFFFFFISFFFACHGRDVPGTLRSELRHTVRLRCSLPCEPRFFFFSSCPSRANSPGAAQSRR